MKLLLANCLNLVEGARGIESSAEQLGPLYVASALRRAFSPAELEIEVTEDALTPARLMASRPTLVGLSAVSQNFHIAGAHARNCKQLGLPVIVGGVHVSTLPATITTDMDVGVVGEGEDTAVELLRVFMSHGGFPPATLAAVKGIAFRDGDRLVQTEPRLRPPDLDTLARPARELLDHPQRGILTGRGCPYDCAFCFSKPFWGRKPRFHSAGYVVEEISELVHRFHAEKIVIYDDLFAASLPRAREIARRLRDAGLHKKAWFVCNARPNEVNDELAVLLKSMNVRRVFLGIESGNQTTLQFLKKRACSVEQNYEAVRILRRHGLMTFGGIIIGSPRETREEIFQTFEFLIRSGIDSFSPLILTPLPGTDVWELAKQRGLVSDVMDWSVLRLEFDETPERQILLSEVLSRRELLDLYLRFRRLQRRKILMLGIKHPLESLREMSRIGRRRMRLARLERTGKSGLKPPAPEVARSAGPDTVIPRHKSIAFPDSPAGV
jgi:radical SAM superfamily enzyme YgiQ (UPF0313 family)